MTRALRWLFPHPYLTALLTIVWLLLQQTTAPGMALFGLVLGIIIPISTARWWPDRPKRVKVIPLLRYILLVVWDIAVANVQVAWIVLTRPNSQIQSAWVVVPLDLKTPEAITMLAGTITLTPGTVSADLSDEGRCLLVHALDANGDPDAVCRDIKNRYERRIKEIFE